MLEKLKEFLNKLVARFLENYEETEEKEEEVEDIGEEKEEEITIFDIIDEVRLSIVPFKIHFPEKYLEFSEKIDKIFKRCEQYYRQDESYLTVCISPESFNTKAEINKIKSEIREFKRNEFNYILINSKIEKLITFLEESYFKVMVYKDKKLCQKFESAFNRIIEEFNKLEFNDDVFKLQVLNYNFTKAIYCLHKCKVWVGYNEDIEFVKFATNSSNMKKIFFTEVQELLEKVEGVKQNRNYEVLKMFFESVLCNEKYDLTDNTLFKKFLDKEKKTYELYLHYNS